MKGVPEYVRFLVLGYIILCFLFICVGNILLYLYIKNRQTKASSYIRAIIICTIPIATISLPIFFYQLSGNYDNDISIKSCNLLLRSQLSVLFTCKIAIVHLIAVMSLMRYLDCKQSIWFHELKSKTILIILATITYCVLIAIPMLYELLNHDRSLICNIGHQEITKNERKTFKMTICIISFGITVTSLTIYSTTMLLRRHIQAHERKFGYLANSGRSINLKRITATLILCISFSFYWIPYGSICGLRGILSDNTFMLLDFIFESVAHSSFFMLPLVYYFMDSGYQRFLRNLLKLRITANFLTKNDFIAVRKLEIEKVYMETGVTMCKYFPNYTLLGNYLIVNSDLIKQKSSLCYERPVFI